MAEPRIWEDIPSDYRHGKLRHKELEGVRETAANYIQDSLSNTGVTFDATQWDRKDLYGIVLGMFLMQGMDAILQLTWLELLDFIIEVDEGYHNNPYHSFRHAVDVTFVVHYMIQSHDAGKYLTDLDISIVLISALCHDVCHPGLNNLFQVNAHTDLAILYNHQSVLENFSCSHGRYLLRKHGLIRNLSDNDQHYFLQSLDGCILSTDMVCHFELITEFNNMIHKLFEGNATVAEVTIHLPLEQNNRTILMKILLHGADISNPCRPWSVCRKWSDLVVEEFFLQGDMEKKIGIPLSPNMDRVHSSQVDIALGFGNVIVRPFFEILATFIPEMQEFTRSLESNRLKWQEVKAIQAAIVKNPPPVPVTPSSSPVKGPSSPITSTTTLSQSSDDQQHQESFEDSVRMLRASMMGRRVSVAAGVITIPENYSVTKPVGGSGRKISYEYSGDSSVENTASITSSAHQSATQLGKFYTVRNFSSRSLSIKDIDHNMALAALGSAGVFSPNQSARNVCESRRASISSSQQDDKKRSTILNPSLFVLPTVADGASAEDVSRATSQSKKLPDATSSYKLPVATPGAIQHSYEVSSSAATSKVEIAFSSSPLIGSVERRLSQPKNFLHTVSTQSNANALQTMLFRSRLESAIVPKN
eukprot:Partr_v1_DN27723_c1_g1_i1_m67801 putative Phosphodiesterase